MKYLKLKGIKRLCSNIGIFVATVGFAFSIGSLVTSIKKNKAMETFVADYKNMRIEQTEDHKEIERVLDLSDKQVFEEAEKSSDKAIKLKLDEIERKRSVQRGHAIGMVGSLAGMSAAMTGIVVTKMKMADIENERSC